MEMGTEIEDEDSSAGDGLLAFVRAQQLQTAGGDDGDRDHRLGYGGVFEGGLSLFRRIGEVQPEPEPARKFSQSLHGPNVVVSADGRSAHRPSPEQQFNQALVVSEKPLTPGELFCVRVDEVEHKWIGSFEIGEFPSRSCFLLLLLALNR